MSLAQTLEALGTAIVDEYAENPDALLALDTFLSVIGTLMIYRRATSTGETATQKEAADIGAAIGALCKVMSLRLGPIVPQALSATRLGNVQAAANALLGL